jgi:hypothetical protein
MTATPDKEDQPSPRPQTVNRLSGLIRCTGSPYRPGRDGGQPSPLESTQNRNSTSVSAGQRVAGGRDRI